MLTLKNPQLFFCHIFLSVPSPFSCILIMCMYPFLLSQICLILCSLFSLFFLSGFQQGKFLRTDTQSPSFLSPAVSISSLFLYYVSAFPIRILSASTTVTSDPSLRIPEFLLCLFRLLFLAFPPACSFCRKVDLVSGSVKQAGARRAARWRAGQGRSPSPLQLLARRSRALSRPRALPPPGPRASLRALHRVCPLGRFPL